MKLSEIKPGETFKTKDHEHIVLAHLEDGTTMCLLKDFWKTALFDDNTGNYANSKIRKELNTEYCKELAADVGTENIVEHIVDLTSDDGRKEYGTVTDKISLLTDSLARRFIDILDKYNPGRWWWLATPLSTKTWKDGVRVVSRYGILDYYSCNNSGGGRPFYILKSNISVSEQE